jgi:hypothetical protein
MLCFFLSFFLLSILFHFRLAFSSPVFAISFLVTFGGVPIGLTVAAKLIQVFDENRNGTIDFNEYCTMHRFISQMRQVRAQMA